MSTLPVQSPATLARRTRALLIASSAVVTLAAWLWLGQARAVHGIHGAFLAPHHHRLDALSFLYVVIMWQAMMVAMMTPTFLRWLTVFATLTEGGPRGVSPLRPATALAGGYFVVWLGYSLVAAAIQVALQQGLLLSYGSVGAAAGALLILTGLFQLTPFKRACLTHCRNPLTYFLSRWMKGPAGGFRLGMAHGAYCVGCCWLLMLTGLAMGVMNLAWMAVLTLVIAAEQFLPGGEVIARVAGVALTGWGLVLLV